MIRWSRGNGPFPACEVRGDNAVCEYPEMAFVDDIASFFTVKDPRQIHQKVSARWSGI